MCTEGKMDKLDVIFNMQAKLNGYIQSSRNLTEMRDFNTAIQKHATALLCELTEVIEETNYKWWKNPKEIDIRRVKEELIDVLHFYISMCLDAGMTSDEMLEIYLSKNRENFDRQNGISQKKGYELSGNSGDKK